MKERPILFATPMVRAILSGAKTQTRRVVKPQPSNRPILAEYGLTVGADPSKDGAEWLDADCINPGKPMRCLCGAPGDRLWVRETWQHFEQAPRDTAYLEDIESNPDRECREILLDALKGRWKPSIHMHRFRSRITLDIESVRVDRLQDISEEDAIAEGVEMASGADPTDMCRFRSYLTDTQVRPLTAYESFRSLWVAINGRESWDANPYVWAITFRKLSINPEP